MLQVKRNHASLSDQLLRIMRALDALEGRFAVAAHHHNSKTYQTHEALSHDLSHLEAGLAPNSAGHLSNTVSGMSLCAVCDAPCHYCVNAAIFRLHSQHPMLFAPRYAFFTFAEVHVELAEMSSFCERWQT